MGKVITGAEYSAQKYIELPVRRCLALAVTAPRIC